jgi:hypothetical protein
VSERSQPPTELTCDLHLPAAAICLAANCDRLLLHRHNIVVVLLNLFDVVVVAELWQLPLKVLVLCHGVKSLYVIHTVDFWHLVTRQRLPFVISLDFCWFS